MQGSRITVIGECVADALPDGHRTAPQETAPQQTAPEELALRVLPGGGPANTAVALGRLGSPVRFLGRLSDDAFGRLFRARLGGSGVGLDDCPRAAEPSTLAVADLDEHGSADWTFHAEGTADWQWTAAELAAVDLSGTACVHAGSLTLVRAPGATAVEEFLVRAAGAGATISLDPNVRPRLVPPSVYRERLARWCALTDILRVSEEDLRTLRPGAPPERACDEWHAAGARLVVVTLGARGALVSLDGERAAVPGVRVRVVDTVAAGDSFTAGFLHHLSGAGLLGGRPTELTLADAVAAAAFGARVAALTCGVAGPNPPWADRLRDPCGTAVS
jgi:fructokinase